MPTCQFPVVMRALTATSALPNAPWPQGTAELLITAQTPPHAALSGRVRAPGRGGLLHRLLSMNLEWEYCAISAFTRSPWCHHRSTWLTVRHGVTYSTDGAIRSTVMPVEASFFYGCGVSNVQR